MSVSTSVVHEFKYSVEGESLVGFVASIFSLNGYLTSINRSCRVLKNRNDKDYVVCKEVNPFHLTALFAIESPDPHGRVSWFANAGQYSCLKAEFKQLMAGRLKERLGGLYTEFEKSVVLETLINAGGPISIKDLRHLNTLAYDMAYLADAIGATEYFCKLRQKTHVVGVVSGDVPSYLSDFSLAATMAVQAWDFEGEQAELSPDREFKVAFGADLKSVLSSCPEKYRNRLVEHMKYKAPEIGDMIARLERKGVLADADSQNPVLYPALEGSVKSDFISDASIALLYDVDLNEPAEQDNVEKKQSLFARLFCCCFAPTNALN